jgi:hypothetical protein
MGPDQAFPSPRIIRVVIGLGSRIGPYEVTAFLGEGGMGKELPTSRTCTGADALMLACVSTFAFE